MLTLSAVLIAAYGNADLAKSVRGEDEGLECEEYTTGNQIFLKHDAPDVAVGTPLVKVAPPAVTSEARFEKVCEKIRIAFAASPGAAEEAIEIARTLRAQVRAEVIAAA